MNASETREQMAVIRWWKLAWEDLGAPNESFLFHVPNGGRRSSREAGIFEKLGVRPGIPDLILLVPRRGFAGMLLEMKGPKGQRSPEQDDFLGLALTSGYLAVTGWSAEEAIALIADYMGEGKFFSRTPPVQIQNDIRTQRRGRRGAAAKAPA